MGEQLLENKNWSTFCNRYVSILAFAMGMDGTESHAARASTIMRKVLEEKDFSYNRHIANNGNPYAWIDPTGIIVRELEHEMNMGRFNCPLSYPDSMRLRKAFRGDVSVQSINKGNATVVTYENVGARSNGVLQTAMTQGRN